MLAEHVMVISFKEDKTVTVVHAIVDATTSVGSLEYDTVIKEIFQHTIDQNPEYQNQEYFMMPKSMLPVDTAGKYINRDAWRMKDGVLIVDETKIKENDGK